MNRDIAQARKIYVDANIIIYFLEGDVERQEKTAELFQYAEENGIALMTSEIAVAECLYGAHKSAKPLAAEDYLELFHEVGMFLLIPVEREISERAAKIGAENGLKLIDAIHVTSALNVGCPVFVTNDRGIRSAEGLIVVQLIDVKLVIPSEERDLSRDGI